MVRVKQLGVRLDQAASNDKAIGVVGAVLFWPALFALGGTKQQEAEYARLKGEYDAVSQAQILKKCSAIATTSPKAGVDVDKDFAVVTNVDAVPYLDARGRDGYREWLNKKAPVTFHHIESISFSAYRSHSVFGIYEPVRFRHLQAS